MTVDGHILLKMLEPAIRPGSTGSSGSSGQVGNSGQVRPGTQPLEQQSFESLLAGQLQAGSQTKDSPSATEQVDDAANSQAAQRSRNGYSSQGPLGQLARVDLIENVSLRNLMSSTASSKAQSALAESQAMSQVQQQTWADDVNENDFAIDGSLQEFLATD